MTDEIIKHIGQLIPLQEEDLKMFLSKFKPVSLKKEDSFIREGQISRKVGFIGSRYT